MDVMVWIDFMILIVVYENVKFVFNYGILFVIGIIGMIDE